MTAFADGEREALAGLVSVPTTHCGLAEQFVEANLRAATAERMREVGAFALDREARRLMELRRSVGFAARAHGASFDQGREVPWMVTLTYADADGWRPNHVRALLVLVRAWCKEQGIRFRYVWVAEPHEGKRRDDGEKRQDSQGRDVLHYHLCLWLPRGRKCPQFDRRGWWRHGMTNTLQANHATGYLMSYLKKGKDLTNIPKGARVYGVGGLDHSLRRARRWLRLPAFVQGNSSILDGWERQVGGGWRSPAGEHFYSEFETCLVAGVRSLRRVRRHPVAIDASGPFSWLSDRERSLALLH